MIFTFDMRQWVKPSRDRELPGASTGGSLVAGPFEVATRAAIEELIQMHAQSSKFGYILTHDGTRELVDSLYDLLLTSRSLKSAGDKFMTGGVTRPKRTPTRL